MVQVHSEIEIDAPVSTVFAYIDDYTTATKWVAGMKDWKPVGDKTQGLGSTFQAKIGVGPTTLEATLEITRWEQDHLIAWEPRKGVKQAGSYTLEDAGGGKTRFVLDIDLELPGGIVGRTLGKGMEPIIRNQISHSGELLKEQVEALPK
ncbi:MAG TPA: SRPBCC family protein [Mycobacteriales bacterium]|nr:SRPBCC family protein [Mycobacteriales bacterium]